MNNTAKKYDNLKNSNTTRKPKLSDYLNIGVCGLIMMFFFVSMFFTTNGGVSQQEKRKLASFPKISEMTSEDLLSGTYFSKIDEFYKDNFVHRDQFLALSDSIDGLKGVESEIKMTVVSNNATNQGATSKDDDSDSDKDMYKNVEQIGTLLSIDNIVCEAYGFNEPTINDYAETIKKFGDTLKGANVYNILVPTHIEFALPSKYQNLSAKEKPAIDLVNSKIGNNVTPVDAYSILKKHKTEYIYFKSDHHWTQLGAYYAYTKYCEAADLKPFKLKDYPLKKVEGFLGTYYSASKDQKLADDPDVVEYRPVGADLTATIYEDSSLTKSFEASPYSDYSTGSNAYGTFLHGDNPLTIIKNPDVDSSKKVVVIKESYGNAFAPLLTQNYSEVYVIDPRYFNGNLNDFIKEHEIKDVIFINNMVAVGSQSRVDELKKLLN